MVLYDETGRQLDSRFLKNEEIIKVSGLLKFDGHLVDIVELKDTNVDGSNCYTQNTVQSKTNNEHLSGLFIYFWIKNFDHNEKVILMCANNPMFH